MDDWYSQNHVEIGLIMCFMLWFFFPSILEALRIQSHVDDSFNHIFSIFPLIFHVVKWGLRKSTLTWSPSACEVSIALSLLLQWLTIISFSLWHLHQLIGGYSCTQNLSTWIAYQGLTTLNMSGYKKFSYSVDEL